ncbi:Low molecular weight phosphotyrosine protein phosphatase [Kibdelosporangium sp. 4NS15]|uniref:protein-tyrosine-phosphatase n=1 Tax=Kibdelosporangium persicum TaxID=2698649 RepID=A0ABX2FCH2_9PSEU|nr:low molecular weight protein-tyrosine-phosphatase [Kibdelosporangium persicum]NRN69051.1 Low molecular weight phosphotyrosine protein phosphatase [Kibdelosporangium persicum]
MHLSFVCTGNICRSPMAALVVREHLRREGLADDVRITSAGTGSWHVGDAADSRAQKVLLDHGYPTAHVAAQVGEEHLGADLLLAMDSGHVRELRGLVDDPSKIRLFRSFDPAATGDLDVPDPYYGGNDGFRIVLAMIEAATPGLIEWVRDELRGA